MQLRGDRREVRDLPCPRLAHRFVDQTRRRLRGRQPLCGIGVTSRMVLMSMPLACSERIADSRPAPGPVTSTSRVRMPASRADWEALCAAIWAANGVPLREPLKPALPADA